MRYDRKVSAKLALIFCGLLFIVCVWLKGRERRTEEAEGEKITCQDVRLLMEAIGAPLPEDLRSADDGAYLTYGQYEELCGAIEGDGRLPDYGDRYGRGSAMEKEDWYRAYQVMLACLDEPHSVWETETFVLGVDEAGGKVHTENGTFTAAAGCRTEELADRTFRSLRLYVRGDEILTVAGELPGAHTLRNVWVTGETEDGLEGFYQDTAFLAPADETAPPESVADLTFREGRAVAVRAKERKVHGRLLRLSDGELEIEGCGVYSVAGDMEVYKLYGSLATLDRTDLRIGYADTDYVIDGGQVCACLISGREDAEKIRVLLRNSVTGGNYHEAAELVVDGERVRISAADLKVGERRRFQCAALTDRIFVYAEGLQGEVPSYRGAIECYRDETGMALINELPLEEYLYAVVPSEMPASYPAEALKAQAVCARTYAWVHILHAGIPELGAHVDDTTAYQVYHNIGESAAATEAVRETDGLVLAREGQAAEISYYSTSCGTGEHTPEELRDEDTFRRFITSVCESDLESGEAWYRWTYTVREAEPEKLYARLKDSYRASPADVQVRREGGGYVSEPPEPFEKLLDIRVAERGPGGVARALLIETDAGTYRVDGEYRIRCALCDGAGDVIRQDGSRIVPKTLVPSGFFVIDAGKRGDSMVGYTLTGGGYGHGSGLSQNGAKALGERGASFEEILRFFFEDCTAVGRTALDGV